MNNAFSIAAIFAVTIVFSACNSRKTDTPTTNDSIMIRLNDFASFTLTTDISKLTDKEKRMIPLLIEAADIMDEIYWIEAYGDKDSLFARFTDKAEQKLIGVHYGPWERLNGNLPMFPGIDSKPAGANFYPADLTPEEFEKLEDKDKTGLYTLIRRNDQGGLDVIPYHVAFQKQVERASELIYKAAELADEPSLKKYLELRAKALLNDDYRASDMAWMDMENNTLDFVVGPIETYEDQLYGYKASHEAFILVKDPVWSGKLKRFAALLPALQTDLPVDNKYKTDIPGTNSDLGVYDVIYYAGDCNAGSKTIAINLPNDEQVQMVKGSRRLQLKNAMQAKFDKILLPISQELFPQEQLPNITFDAFFTNTMFHEVAHGLGPINTINGKGSIRESLREHYTTIEEGKADILGLYLETRLNETGELETNLMNAYTTFMAGIFRSIRFGATSAHGKANLIRYNYFKETGAFIRDSTGVYSVDFEKMKKAVQSLSTIILTIQGDGDYDGAARMITQYGVMDETLRADLKAISEKEIPVDIVFEQGLNVLGL